MIPSLRRCRRESPAPVKARHTGRGKKVEPPFEVEVTPLLLNWRELVCRIAVNDFLREIAAGSEAVSLEEDRVTLRPVSHSVVTPGTAEALGGALAALKGHPFTVAFTEEDCGPDAPTVSRLKESEARKARLALIEAFKSDPFVQKCVQFFNGTVDETSVKPYPFMGKED